MVRKFALQSEKYMHSPINAIDSVQWPWQLSEQERD